MRRFLLWLIGLIVIGLVAAAAGLAYVRVTGLTARAKPSEAETGLARAVRSFAISGRDRARTNPVPRSEAAMQAGLEHFADHCAVCHGHDGGGGADLRRGRVPAWAGRRA